MPAQSAIGSQACAVFGRKHRTAVGRRGGRRRYGHTRRWASERTTSHLLDDRLDSGLQPSQLGDGVLALVVEVSDLRNGALTVLLDALQVGVTAALGLVPDREGTSRGLVDNVSGLATRHLAQLAHLFSDRLAKLVHFAFGLLTQRVGPLPRLLEDALDAFTESVQRRRLSGAGLTLVDGDAAVQLPELPNRCCEAALRLRGAV